MIVSTSEVPDVVLAAATAADWVAWSVSFVVCGGSVNEPSPVVAACDEPAYPVIAATSWAQNSPYSASAAAIAVLFCPKMLVCNSDSSWVRFAAISAGGTVAANAVSVALAPAGAWPAVVPACPAVVDSHDTYGAAAAAAASDDAPCQSPLMSP